MSNDYTPGPFAIIFAWVGLFAGGAAGYEIGGGMEMLVGAIILAIGGAFIGRLADAILAWLIFVAVAVVAFLINATIRQFVWDVISSLIQS